MTTTQISTHARIRRYYFVVYGGWGWGSSYMMDEVATAIHNRRDRERYRISTSSKIGIATWKVENAEVARAASPIDAARAYLSRRPNSPLLCASISCILGYRNVEAFVDRASGWMVWRRHWFYGGEIVRNIHPMYRVVGRFTETPDDDVPICANEGEERDNRSMSSRDDRLDSDFGDFAVSTQKERNVERRTDGRRSDFGDYDFPWVRFEETNGASNTSFNGHSHP